MPKSTPRPTPRPTPRADLTTDARPTLDWRSISDGVGPADRSTTDSTVGSASEREL
jgi:hypothetical protein